MYVRERERERERNRERNREREIERERALNGDGGSSRERRSLTEGERGDLWWNLPDVRRWAPTTSREVVVTSSCSEAEAARHNFLKEEEEE